MKTARFVSFFFAIVLIAGATPSVAFAQQAHVAPAGDPRVEGIAAAVSANAEASANALGEAKASLEKKLRGKASRGEVAKIRKDLARIAAAEARIAALEHGRSEAQSGADRAKSEAETTKAEVEVIKTLAEQLEDETAAKAIQAYLDRSASDARVAVRGALAKDCPKGWAIAKLAVHGDSLVLRCRPAFQRTYDAFSEEKESDVLKARAAVEAEATERNSASFKSVFGRGLLGGVLVGIGTGAYAATQADDGHKLQDGLLNGVLWGAVGTGATMLLDAGGRAVGLWK